MEKRIEELERIIDLEPIFPNSKEPGPPRTFIASVA